MQGWAAVPLPASPASAAGESQRAELGGPGHTCPPWPPPHESTRMGLCLTCETPPHLSTPGSSALGPCNTPAPWVHRILQPHIPHAPRSCTAPHPPQHRTPTAPCPRSAHPAGTGHTPPRPQDLWEGMRPTPTPRVHRTHIAPVPACTVLPTWPHPAQPPSTQQAQIPFHPQPAHPAHPQGTPPRPPPAAVTPHAPDTDAGHGLRMQQGLILRVHQLQCLILQQQQHRPALRGAASAGGPRSHAGGCWSGRRAGQRGTHLPPSTRGATLVQGELADAVVDSYAAPAWCQLVLTHLHPAQRAHSEALQGQHGAGTAWGPQPPACPHVPHNPWGRADPAVRAPHTRTRLSPLPWQSLWQHRAATLGWGSQLPPGSGADPRPRWGQRW